MMVGCMERQNFSSAGTAAGTEEESPIHGETSEVESPEKCFRNFVEWVFKS